MMPNKCSGCKHITSDGWSDPHLFCELKLDNKSENPCSEHTSLNINCSSN